MTHGDDGVAAAGLRRAPGRRARDSLIRFVPQRYGPPGRGGRRLLLEVRPLRGGSQAAEVALVRARWVDPQDRARLVTFVAKRLAGAVTREAAVYEALAAGAARPPAPRLLHVERHGPAACSLYLEYVRPWRRWPWGDVGLAGRVLEQLAHLHAAPPEAASRAAVADWDYEAELRASAGTTLEALERTTRWGALAGLRRGLPPLRRLIAALPAGRRPLLAAGPFGPCVLHGDVHPGNAVIRAASGVRRAALLDWGRTRRGAPLEDVSSWLQSLGFWEPEARRRHDTLLRHYLTRRRLQRPGRGAALPPGRGRRVAAAAGAAARGALRAGGRADACWGR